jgi:membrane protease subunit HflK
MTGDRPKQSSPVTGGSTLAGSPGLTPAQSPEEAGSQALADALKSSFAIVRVVMVVLVVIFLFSGFFTVGPQEKAVVLRFGKPVGAGDKALLGPGPHWAFPAPIDEVKKIPIGEVQTVHSTIGWYAGSMADEVAGGEPPPMPSLNPSRDGYVLTGDENIIHIRGTLLYRINEPGLRYAFNFVSSSNLVQNTFENALLFASAGYKVDDILTRDVAGFRDRVRARLEALVAEYGLGVTIDQVNLRAIPPRQLTRAFAAVLEADVRRSKVLNDARSYENQTISRARAEAEARKNAGETERNALVTSVRAESEAFKGLLPQYQANPELFIQQQQNQVLQRVLTNAQDRIVLPRRTDGKPREVRLQLNPEPRVPKPTEQPAEDKH